MRGSGLDDAIAVVAPIVADVRARGDDAVLEWTERFDGPRPDGFRVPAEAIADAVVEADVLEALRAMILAVRTFSEAQRPRDTAVEAAPGIVSERRWLPLDSVGICVPSGTFPLPSSLVMAAVPALVAGVRRVAVVTPSPVAATLAVARELGLDEVYAIGGAQAVAALAYGTASIEPVDRIVGPGNAYVTAAKLLVSTRVGIDLPAGPSEVIVIADETADPHACAADLLAQAEHGSDSEALLLSTDPGAVRHGRHARCSITTTCEIETVASLADALARSEAFAPEHLELHVADPEALLAGVRNAGSVFIGGSAVVGDYAAGATHVLPTGGLARSSGGLGLEMFMKPLQVVRATACGRRSSCARRRSDRAGGRAAASCGRRRTRTGARMRRERRDPSRSRRDPAAGRLRAVQVGCHGGGRRRAPRSRAGRGAEVRPEHAAAARGRRRFRSRRASRRWIGIRDGLYRELREAAAGYVSDDSGTDVGWEQVVVGAGADDLIMLCARTFLAPGRKAAMFPQTYSFYRVVTLLSGVDPVTETDGASVIWRCNPENPTGAVTPTSELVELRASQPGCGRDRRRGVYRVRRRIGRSLAR